MLRSRARRLLRWYPKEWRSRYGDEFVELLVADMEERPHSLHRSLDVVRGGAVARSASAGLGGQPLDPEDAPRRSLVAIGGALSIFLVFALAMWAQLTIGWQWSPPNTAATSLAMFVMSAAIVAVGVLASPPRCRSSGPSAAALLARSHRRSSPSPARRHRWHRHPRRRHTPLRQRLARHGRACLGPAGHRARRRRRLRLGLDALRDLVLGPPGRPGRLSRPAEVAWMVVSPIALAATLVGLAKLVRRLELSPRVLRYERRLTLAITLAMAAFFTGAGMWVFDGGPGPRNLFHIGAIDLIDLGALALAMVVTGLAVRRVGAAVARGSPPTEPAQPKRSPRRSMNPDVPTNSETPHRTRWTRRQILTAGLGGVAGVVLAGAAGVELVSHGVLPGKQTLDQLDGACSVSSPEPQFAELGHSLSGSFHSQARRRAVGYTIAWPPGAEPGTPLPLVVMLHGEGGNHTNALSGMKPSEAVALVVDGRPCHRWPWSPSTEAAAIGTPTRATTPWRWSSPSSSPSAKA